MKKLAVLMSLIIMVTSCIPIRIAPNIKDYNIKVAKHFKRKLPDANAFIFEDPKEADMFYHFINDRFQLDHIDVYSDVPVIIEGNPYYISFYEAEIPTKVINFIPTILDAGISALINDDEEDTSLLPPAIVRTGNWYVLATVTDRYGRDCLKPDFHYRENLIEYLSVLKNDYLLDRDVIISQ